MFEELCVQGQQRGGDILKRRKLAIAAQRIESGSDALRFRLENVRVLKTLRTALL